MKHLTTSVIIAMLCIAICNSITISKYRGGRVLGFVPCTTNAQCLTTGNSPVQNEKEQCNSRSGICECIDKLQPLEDNLDCVARPGSDCSLTDDLALCTAANDLGLKCFKDADNTETTTVGAAGTQTCKCKSPKISITIDGKAECAGGIGTACPNGNECKLDNMECKNKFCLCAPGSSKKDGQCLISVGGTCLSNTDCKFPNQMCSNGKCSCKPNFSEDSAGTCMASVDGSCAADGQDGCTLQNQECQNPDGSTTGILQSSGKADSTCQCKDLFALNDENDCVKSAGATCDDSGDDPGDKACTLTYQKCFAVVSGKVDLTIRKPDGAGVCGCDPSTGTEAQDGVCVRQLGQDCAADKPCELKNSECASDGHCRCKAGFQDSNGDSTDGGSCSVPVDGSCKTGGTDDCTLDNLGCFEQDGTENTNPTGSSDDTCKCKPMFAEDKDGFCVNSVGADCSVKGEADCTLDHQRCENAAGGVVAANPNSPVSGATCKCIPMFVKNDDNGQCVADIGAPCPNGDECTKAGTACDAVTQKCVESVGGACPNGNECKLTNQECADDNGEGKKVTTVGINQNCRCVPGWLQNPDEDDACTKINFDLCKSPDPKFPNQQGPCEENQGDCDRDDECKGDLKCGINNCGTDRELADCCFDASASGIVCDENNDNFWACCQPGPDPNVQAGSCGDGQGDCDDDSDCQAGLKCHPDSCASPKYDKFFPRGQGDCCGPPSSFFYQMQSLMNALGFDGRKEDFQNEEEPEQ